MILKTNKLSAYGLTHAVKSLLVVCLFISNGNKSQDTVFFQNVEISAKKTELSQVGKKTELIDSVVKDQFKYNSIADLLSYNSSVFIKNYGPGGLATTALRGGNAAQTALLWNGFNLQNAMLGQADLALMPSVLFENIGVEYGGSSSLWGSGAIAGSIHLNNKTAFNQGLISKVNFGFGSFGALNGSAAVLISKRRFISSTKIYMQGADNNFKYKDTLDKENSNKRQKNAEYNFKGLMQEIKFLINSHQILSVNAWLSTNQRHLPTYNKLESKTYQQDDAIRLTANWNYIKRRFRANMRGAYFIDNIDYSDSLSSIFSKSSAKTFMLENENYFRIHKNYQVNLAMNAQTSSAHSENYRTTETLNRISLLLGNEMNFFNKRLLAYVSGRIEYFSVGTLPFTGNVSLEYKISKVFTAKTNLAKVYRQPTLNELYWVPGGNPNLKPEQGYTYEGELNFSKQVKNIFVFISGSAYSRNIDNWILWIPGPNNNPTPVNIQTVWSRGTETTWKVHYQKNKFRMGTNVVTAYVLSTVQTNSRENDNSEGKQLIYTPRYTVNGNVSLGYSKLDLVFYHQYAGYRFTSSDNLTWLAPYQISSLRLNYKLRLKEVDMSFYTACNNVFNTNYTVLMGRPMPLRHFEFGISIQTKSININK